jgi:hypothetical protein
MNPGKTHLIASLQPKRFARVKTHLMLQALHLHTGGAQRPLAPMLTAEAYAEISKVLDKHAAKVVWDEEYVEETSV